MSSIPPEATGALTSLHHGCNFALRALEGESINWFLSGLLEGADALWMCLWAQMGREGRYSQVGGDGVPFPLPHRQHEVGDPGHQAGLVSVVIPMLLSLLQLHQETEDKGWCVGGPSGTYIVYLLCWAGVRQSL